MADERANELTVRQGQVVFVWPKGHTQIRLVPFGPQGEPLPLVSIPAPKGLKYEDEAFTLWVLEYLGIMDERDRPVRILISEARKEAPLDREAVMGNADLIADADYVFVFRDSEVTVVKSRDIPSEDVHVAIQRRT